jgi:polyhydroxyalkanoate synthesis regulator phasin
MEDLTTAVSNRQAIAIIKRRYSTGEITRDEAKVLAEPILNRINSKQAEIAKKYGKKNYPKLDFINALR